MASLAAVTVRTVTGNGADTLIVGSTSADTNHGNNPTLLLKNVSPVNAYTRKEYLRFDPAGLGEISAASLDLLVDTNNNGKAGFPSSFKVAPCGLNDSTAVENWREGSITWNNAPGNINSGGFFASATAAFLGTLAITTSDVGGDTVSFSSSALLAFLAADTDYLVTIMLARTDTRVGENLAFLSKEAFDGTKAPSLTLRHPKCPPFQSPHPAASSACFSAVARSSSAGGWGGEVTSIVRSHNDFIALRPRAYAPPGRTFAYRFATPPAPPVSRQEGRGRPLLS